MSRNYEALLLDLDGTLLMADESIHPRTRGAILDAEAAGATVMVVTGRSKISALPIVDALGLKAPTVLFNGCAIWDSSAKRMLEERTLANRTLERLHGWAGENDAQVIAMTADEKVALEPRSDEERRNFDGFIGVQFGAREDLLREYTIRLSFLLKCGERGSAAAAQELEDAAAAPIYVSHFPLSILPRHRTNPYSAIDVHAPCRGKAEALRFLEETQGIPPERIVAIGDADNDIPMLRAAGLGIAMGNALPEVQAEADRVAAHHDGDTIGALVEELFLR